MARGLLLRLAHGNVQHGSHSVSFELGTRYTQVSKGDTPFSAPPSQILTVPAPAQLRTM